jgi:hypothetical protein
MEDEPAFIAAHEAMKADDFVSGLFYEPGMAWAEYLDSLDRCRRGGGSLPPDRVHSSFLVADVNGTIVGRVSIRHPGLTTARRRPSVSAASPPTGGIRAGSSSRQRQRLRRLRSPTTR